MKAIVFVGERTMQVDIPNYTLLTPKSAVACRDVAAGVGASALVVSQEEHKAYQVAGSRARRVYYTKSGWDHLIPSCDDCEPDGAPDASPPPCGTCPARIIREAA